jgi:hypothetical protein
MPGSSRNVVEVFAAVAFIDRVGRYTRRVWVA